MDLPKPLGLKFARGNDGGAYVVTNDPKLGNTDPRIQVGITGICCLLRTQSAHQQQQQQCICAGAAVTGCNEYTRDRALGCRPGNRRSAHIADATQQQLLAPRPLRSTAGPFECIIQQ